MSWRAGAVRVAERLMGRYGWTYDHLLGVRFAINVFLATIVVWVTLQKLGDTKPIWAIASMVAACDPEVAEARRLFRARLLNVLVGCAVGLVALLIGTNDWVLPTALAVTVLVSSYVVRIKTMWRQAPITAAVVIASGLALNSTELGLRSGLHKVGEVIFGCLVGLIVSWLMSRVWIISRPPPSAAAA